MRLNIVIAVVLLALTSGLVYRFYTPINPIKQEQGYEFNYLAASTTSDDGTDYGVLVRLDSRNMRVTRIMWAELDYAHNRVIDIASKDYGNRLKPFCVSIAFTESGLQSVAYFPNSKNDNSIIGGLETHTISIESKSVTSEFVPTNFIAENDRIGRISKAFLQNNGDVIVSTVLHETYRVSSNGEFIATDLDTFNYDSELKTMTEWHLRKPIVVIGSGLAVAVLFLLLCIVVKKLKLKISLLFKQAVVILIIMCVGGYVLLERIRENFIEEQEDALVFALRKTIHKAVNSLNLERLQNIDWNDVEALADNEYYNWLWERFSYGIDYTDLQIIRNDDDQNYMITLEENYYILLRYPDFETTQWRVAVNEDKPVGTSIYDTEPLDIAIKYNELITTQDTNGLVIGLRGDSDWLSMVIPIFNKESKTIIALVECGMLRQEFEYRIFEKTSELILVLVAIMGATVLVMAIGLGVSIKPLKRLKKAVELVGEGDYNIDLPIKGNDEIAQISKSFNIMSQKIDKHTQGLMELNEAYFRFLPLEFLDKLGKESVVETEEGDCSLIDAYIANISIVGFTKATEKSDSSDAFALFNQISSVIMNEVSAHNGLIASTESGSQMGFVCFFANEEDALTASYVIRRKFNSQFIETVEINCTIAIVEGEALIGVVGHEKRLCTFSISESVKLTERLSRIAEKYGVGVITTISPKTHKDPKIRYLGKIDESTLIYDYYNGESEEVFFSKNKTRELFEQAVKHFENSDYNEAKLAFIEYLKHSIPDAAARQYLFLSEHNLKNPDGIRGFGG